MERVDGTSFSQSLRPLYFLLGLFLQAVVAVLGSMLIGILPEAFTGRYYYNSGLEAYSPAILAVAIILGYLATRKYGHSPAMWVWIIGLAWLAFGVYEESSYWHMGLAPSRLDFIASNFFGSTRRCSDTECLGEFFFTTPFAATVGYSLGAGFGLRSYRKTEPPRTNLANT
jgi:hypothetical protein